jgi:DNA-binding transcriptional ArsR family regulator
MAPEVSIQSLRVFLFILEHGSLSAAGRELGMTQPAVSNHLHALEERFGVKLLIRGGVCNRRPPENALWGTPGECSTSWQYWRRS